MLYTRNQINKYGDIIAFSDDKKQLLEAESHIDKWRKSHLPVMDEITEIIKNDFSSNGIGYAFTSKRLKRIDSILIKLRNNRERSMKLGGLHDIIGQRFVFDDMDGLNKAISFMESYEVEGYTKKSSNDYIRNPKTSGYRSYHVVFEKVSEDSSLNGIKIEVQLRTRLQHKWAMAVETAGIIDKSSIKSGEGSDEWKEFFKIVSALFSIKEITPSIEMYRSIPYEEIMKQFCHYTLGYKLIEKLDNVKTIMSNTDVRKDGYQVVTSDFSKKDIVVRNFDISEKDDAYEYYTSEEQRWITYPKSVVMVSVSSLKELKDAYPSYFNDATEFVEEIKEYSMYCSRFLK